MLSVAFFCLFRGQGGGQQRLRTLLSFFGKRSMCIPPLSLSKCFFVAFGGSMKHMSPCFLFSLSLSPSKCVFASVVVRASGSLTDASPHLTQTLKVTGNPFLRGRNPLIARLRFLSGIHHLRDPATSFRKLNRDRLTLQEKVLLFLCAPAVPSFFFPQLPS